MAWIAGTHRAKQTEWKIEKQNLNLDSGIAWLARQAELNKPKTKFEFKFK